MAEGVGAGVAVAVQIGVGVGAEVGSTWGIGVLAAGVGVGELDVVGGVVGIGIKPGIIGADGFGSFKNGTKLTMPKFVAFLKSQIVWLIAEASVVPHQLSVAFTFSNLVEFSVK